MFPKAWLEDEELKGKVEAEAEISMPEGKGHFRDKSGSLLLIMELRPGSIPSAVSN